MFDSDCKDVFSRVPFFPVAKEAFFFAGGTNVCTTLQKETDHTTPTTELDVQ